MTAKTDRELLELAAKAAGIEGAYQRVHQTYGAQWVDGISISGQPIFWNPLTSDGDALRLAVKLNLAITCSNHEAHVEGPRGADEYAWEPHGSDAHAATRRAIVRAAAAIGETL